MISIDQAYELLDQNVVSLPIKTTELADCVGCVLAEAVSADIASPPHDKSVMDGFAVRSSDVSAGYKRLRIVETIIAGDWPKQPLSPGEAARIMTGAPLPVGADAVVMVEQTETEMAEQIEWVTLDVDSIAPEKHVLRRGINFCNGQTVFSAGHVVRPTDIGLLAEVGADKVVTGRKPSVAVLPTGNELVGCDQIPNRGQIRNSNGPMLIAMARSLGLDVSDLGVGRDDREELRTLIRRGLEHDLLILSGGVSSGTMDLVPEIFKELGVQEVFHKVFVKPGKPIWFGVLDHDQRRTCVFGLPGNPVSSLVGFQLFVRASIRKLMGGRINDWYAVTGELSQSHETRGDRPTYWPGKWELDDNSVRKIKPLVWRGSSDLLALGEAEGLIFFQGETTDHPVGEHVLFYPFG